MSENHLDTPFAYTGLERDLAAALDERDAIIAHQRRQIIARETRRALPASIGVLALPVGVALGVWLADTPWAWCVVAGGALLYVLLPRVRRWLRGRAAQGTEIL